MSNNSTRNYRMNARPADDYVLKTKVITRIKEAMKVAQETGKVQVIRDVVIDKDSCLDILTLNHGNRDVMYLDVARYANKMNEESWEDYVDDLVVTSDGHLRNGQKRLWATNVLTSSDKGKPNFSWKIDIKVGQSPSVAGKLDAGRVRSLGDVLKDNGFTDTNNLAACVRNIYYLETFRRIGTHIEQLERMTNDDIVKWTENKKNVALVEKFLLKLNAYKGAMTFLSRSAFVTVWYLLHKKGVEEAAWFMDKLATGVDLSSSRIKDSNLSLLRNRLIAIDRNPVERKGTVRADERYRLIFHVWNSNKSNLRLQNLKPDLKSWDIEKPL